MRYQIVLIALLASLSFAKHEPLVKKANKTRSERVTNNKIPTPVQKIKQPHEHQIIPLPAAPAEDMRAPRPPSTPPAQTSLPALPQMVTAAVQTAMNRIQTEGITTNLITVTGNGNNVIKGNLSVSGPVTLGTEPVANSDATTKLYVDTVAHGLNGKSPCRLKSLPTDGAGGNITLSGTTQTLDGILPSVGDRVLLNNQTNGVENGIWVVQAGSWTRPADFADGSNAAAAYTIILAGATYINTWWICTNSSGHAIVGVDTLSFSQFSGPGTYSMQNVGTGAGVYRDTTGDTFNLRSLNGGTGTTSGSSASNITVTQNANDISITMNEDIVVHDVNTQSVEVGDGVTTRCSIDGTTGNICTMGSVSAFQSSCPSDARIKTNVKTLSPQESLQIIEKLRPVEYNFTQNWRAKNNLSDTRQAGLIAQEVQQVLPGIVRQVKFPTGDEINTVTYGELIPYLVNCVQALSKEVAILRARMDKK